MDLVPSPEPRLVAGRPNIYGIYYPLVNGWYVGKNETGVATYMGSPSDAARKAIMDAHAANGVSERDIVSEKHILWSPPDATIADCRDQEWAWIARFRACHDGPVFNKFPIEDWSDHFEWKHDKETHVDRATNSRWPVVYVKLQASCDANGNCSGGKNGRYSRECGRDWGSQTRGLYWCKVIHPDGREDWLYEPGPHQTLPFTRFRQHKLKMISSADGA